VQDIAPDRLARPLLRAEPDAQAAEDQCGGLPERGTAPVRRRRVEQRADDLVAALGAVRLGIGQQQAPVPALQARHAGPAEG
jgi:hypothetical protein